MRVITQSHVISQFPLSMLSFYMLKKKKKEKKEKAKKEPTNPPKDKVYNNLILHVQNLHQQVKNKSYPACHLHLLNFLLIQNSYLHALLGFYL